MSRANRGVATGSTRLVEPSTLDSDRLVVSVIAESWVPGDRFRFDETSVDYKIKEVSRENANFVFTLEKKMGHQFPAGTVLNKIRG
jgi:hypothetical protein